ncbi:3-methyl-2-oxobutanoate hydroxymethyltransferase [Phytophthora ramorum]|uniref:3-methyl-2-oxobutanoate hydroxymethyltransferase n=1 Tax=Phytophthora ramorum TaxID=164328 RepID=UPI0030B1153C|nr:3-methyl-2-oxobutanoate hydroxymethyltransferase [Phytophthora ramorum]
MIHHTQVVKRGANRPLVITNTPFGSCEGSPRRDIDGNDVGQQEGGAGCVQVDGGKERAETITFIPDGGIAVIGHMGLRRQHTTALGGFRAQGRTRSEVHRRRARCAEAKAGVVLECVHYHYGAVRGLELLRRRADEGPDEFPADVCHRRDREWK